MSDNGTLFRTYLAQRLQTIEEHVASCTPSARKGCDQADDLNRFLFKPLTTFVSGGGKRIRPALCLLGAEAVGGNPNCALSVAAAVELFQAAALIHDDIADESTLRRGMPCMHIAEGVGLAINAGDGALVAVTACVLNDESLDATTRLQLLNEIVEMENRTLEGQALDLGWARDDRWDITVSDYLAMARRKTAYYSAAVPLAMGAISANGTEGQIEGLRRFGMRAGLAFQIQDDLLNLVGDAEAQGKDYRSDITEGKRTLVMVHALSNLEEADRTELVNILLAKTSDAQLVDRAVELAQKAGSLDYARTFARDLIGTAKGELAALDIAEEARAVLISMADYFVERAS